MFVHAELREALNWHTSTSKISPTVFHRKATQPSSSSYPTLIIMQRELSQHLKTQEQSIHDLNCHSRRDKILVLADFSIEVHISQHLLSQITKEANLLTSSTFFSNILGIEYLNFLGPHMPNLPSRLPRASVSTFTQTSCHDQSLQNTNGSVNVYLLWFRFKRKFYCNHQQDWDSLNSKTEGNKSLTTIMAISYFISSIKLLCFLIVPQILPDLALQLPCHQTTKSTLDNLIKRAASDAQITSQLSSANIKSRVITKRKPLTLTSRVHALLLHQKLSNWLGSFWGKAWGCAHYFPGIEE